MNCACGRFGITRRNACRRTSWFASWPMYCGKHWPKGCLALAWAPAHVRGPVGVSLQWQRGAANQDRCGWALRDASEAFWAWQRGAANQDLLRARSARYRIRWVTTADAGTMPG